MTLLRLVRACTPSCVCSVWRCASKPDLPSLPVANLLSFFYKPIYPHFLSARVCLTNSSCPCCSWRWIKDAGPQDKCTRMLCHSNACTQTHLRTQSLLGAGDKNAPKQSSSQLLMAKFERQVADFWTSTIIREKKRHLCYYSDEFLQQNTKRKTLNVIFCAERKRKHQGVLHSARIWIQSISQLIHGSFHFGKKRAQRRKGTD